MIALAILSAARAGAATISAGTDHSMALKDDGTVWLFGANGSGQLGNGTTTPSQVPVQASGLNSIVAVAAGNAFSVALDESGAVYTWGDNSAGQLGDGNTSTNRTTPYHVLMSGVTITMIAAGDQFVLALANDGKIWSWGANANGQLGDNSTTQRNSPVQVRDVTGAAGTSLSGITAIAAGGFHSLAVHSSGVVYAFGKNGNGQLGIGSTVTPKKFPVQMNTLTSVSAVSAGLNFSLALKSDGSLWSCGQNTNGQLGNASTSQQTAPVQVKGPGGSGNLTNVGAIDAGDTHSLAIKNDGSAWAWGNPANGRLGENTTTGNKTTPVQVKDTPGTGTLQNVVAISGGVTHSLAVRSGSPGSAWAWGGNATGKLGDNSTTERHTPVQVSGSGFVWMAKTPTFSPAAGTYGSSQNVAITTTTPYSTIHYTIGQSPLDPALTDPILAAGQTVPVTTSTTIKAKAWSGTLAPSNVAQASYTLKVATPTFSPGAGSYGSAQSVTISTVTPDASIYYTTNGNEPSQGSTPYTVPVSVGTATTLKAKAFKQDWTESDTGSAAYSFNFGTLNAPTLSPSSGTYLSEVTVTMSALSGASIYYTMDGTTPSQSSSLYTGPLSVDLSMTLKAKAFHPDWTASATASGTYTIIPFVDAPTFDVAPGEYRTRQTVHITTPAPGVVLHYTTTGATPTLADPTVPAGGITVDRGMIVKANGWNSGFLVSPVARADYRITGAIATGFYHSLALKEDGTVLSTGDNSYGQLGVNTSTLKRSSFAAVASLPSGRAIAAGAYHSLVLGSDGSVWAFGYNDYGQLGFSGSGQWQPVQVTAGALNGVAASGVAAGLYSSYAIRASDGAVIAWGQITGSATPAVISGLSQIVALAPGDRHCLALKADGTLYAWGQNSYGQVGNGTWDTPITTPVAVGSLTGVKRIAAGSLGSYALKTDGQLSGTTWSWGIGGNGQLGNGSTASQNAPVSTLTGTLVLGAGNLHALAARIDGSTWAWGYNGSYSLGDGSGEPQSTVPVRVREMSEAVALSGGYRFSLAVKVDGSLWGWGEANYGQLGDAVGTYPRQVPFKAPSLALVPNDWMLLDTDADGLSNAAEYRWGTDPLDADSNADGLSDGVEVELGVNPTSLDVDGDGLSNAAERTLGTDPFKADTDGDGVADGADAFPFDSTRWGAPTLDPSDHTPPTITILEPANAVPLP